MPQSHIRNFCIIAHIDHGKSTLADRLLELTGTIMKRNMQEQVLDSNPIERERGITIKLAPVRMKYRIMNNESRIKGKNYSLKSHDSSFMIHDSNSEYILNLIDTPGHVDFNYEVSRSLAACEGAILVIDATQGVQAQTLANLNLARKQNLTIIPVINKIDLPNAEINRCLEELGGLGFASDDVLQISAKTGKNVDQVLTAIVNRIPTPNGSTSSPFRALIFSSIYDTHKGVVVYVRIVDGDINSSFISQEDNSPPPAQAGSPPLKLRGGRGALLFMASGAETLPVEIGYFMPTMLESKGLLTGEVGYIATGFKDVALARVGDTVTVSTVNRELRTKNIEQKHSNQSLVHGPQFTVSPLAGYHEPKPMVFLGLYPINSNEYEDVRTAMGKLRLSDSAFTFKPISSLALGNGFHCGFLGLLHAEVVQERLQREFGLNLLATAPTVEYKIKFTVRSSPFKVDEAGYMHIQSATEYPDPGLVTESLEPVMEVSIFSPKKYTGKVMQLCQSKRAEFVDLVYITEEQGKFTYLMPLSEMIIDFFDELKSSTEGYASLDYSLFDYQPVELVKLDILLNHEKVDAFSQLVVRDRAEYLGRKMVDKLKDVIPKHQFAVPIQAAIGGTVIARSDVKPYRKDVTQKLYGGDRTRKDKLLEAQKKGKKRMKQVGNVEIPQDAFLKVFSRG